MSNIIYISENTQSKLQEIYGKVSWDFKNPIYADTKHQHYGLTENLERMPTRGLLLIGNPHDVEENCKVIEYKIMGLDLNFTPDEAIIAPKKMEHTLSRRWGELPSEQVINLIPNIDIVLHKVDRFDINYALGQTGYAFKPAYIRLSTVSNVKHSV
jgi:hypothetical protein